MEYDVKPEDINAPERYTLERMLLKNKIVQFDKCNFLKKLNEVKKEEVLDSIASLVKTRDLSDEKINDITYLFTNVPPAYVSDFVDLYFMINRVAEKQDLTFKDVITEAIIDYDEASEDDISNLKFLEGCGFINDIPQSVYLVGALLIIGKGFSDIMGANYSKKEKPNITELTIERGLVNLKNLVQKQNTSDVSDEVKAFFSPPSFETTYLSEHLSGKK